MSNHPFPSLSEGFDPATIQRLRSTLDLSLSTLRPDSCFDDSVAGIVESLRASLHAAHVSVWVVVAYQGPGKAIMPRGTPGCEHWLAPLYSTFRVEREGDEPPMKPLPLVGSRGEAVLARVDAGVSPAAVYYPTTEDGPAAAHRTHLQRLGYHRMWVFPITGAGDAGHPEKLIGLGTAVFPDETVAEAIPPEAVDLYGHVAGRLLQRALWAEKDLLIRQTYGVLDRADGDFADEFDKVCKAVAEVMRFEACTTLVVDPRADSLNIIGSTGVDTTMPRSEWQYALEHLSCTGKVARDKYTLATDNVLTHPDRKQRHLPDRVSEGAGGHFLASPVLSQSEHLLGVVRLRARKGFARAGWVACLTHLDVMRGENLAKIIAPLLTVVQESRRTDAALERIRHDLDVPALMIRNSAGIMARAWGGISGPMSSPYLQRVADIESLAGVLLINSTLMSLSDPKHVPLKTQQVFLLNTFVAGLCKLLLPMARRRRLAGIEYDPATFQSLPKLWVDPKLLQIALYNLLQNAIKYSDEGKGIDVRARGRHEFAGRFWYGLEVSNTGLGVTEEEERSLFRRYYRSPRAAERSVSGIGLGLSTAKALVERHGGRLDLERRHDPTTFIIRLPVDLAVKEPA